MNADTTQDEVAAALKGLKRTQAAGVDGIRAEFILDAVDKLLGPLVHTFNQVLVSFLPYSRLVIPMILEATEASQSLSFSPTSMRWY